MLYSLSKSNRAETLARKKVFADILTESLASMFARDGLPEEIDARFIELILIENGVGAYWKYKGKYVFTYCDLAGMPDAYGLGRDAIVRTMDGYTQTFTNWRENVNIVVCFNNSVFTPDLAIDATANALYEIDTSLEFNTIYSRLYPLPIVSDDKQKNAIENIFNNMLAGKYQTIVSGNILKEINGEKEIDVANLTDVKSVEYIQHLAKYRDDIMRWFWNLYGQNMQNSSKLAQQTVSEIEGGSSASMIIPHARYHERLRECEELKRKFNWDVTVYFTEPWVNSFSKCDAEKADDETTDAETTDAEIADDEKADEKGE